MRKNLLFVLSLLLWTTLCHALEIQPNTWTDFEGTLGKTNIELSLFRFENGQIKGNYCYRKYDKKIQLTGQIKGNQLEFTEIIDGKKGATFRGKVFTDDRDRFTGTWIDETETRSLDVKLTLASICGNDFDHRYTDFYGTDDETERFMKLIKTSILTNDKATVASNISYPINVTIGKQQKFKIKNKQSLIANFDKIFTPKYKEAIRLSRTCNLFCNYQGAMLADGKIWINNKPGSVKGKYGYTVIAINN